MRCADMKDGMLRVPMVSGGMEGGASRLFQLDDSFTSWSRYQDFMAVLRRDNPGEFARKVLVNHRVSQGGGQ